MPKLTAGNVPKYRHHKARGLAVVRINGTDHYLGPWKSKASLVEYDRLIGEWLTHGRSLAVDDAPEPVTVVEIIAAYVKHAGGYYVKSGKRTNEYDCIVLAMKPLARISHQPYRKRLPSLA